MLGSDPRVKARPALNPVSVHIVGNISCSIVRLRLRRSIRNLHFDLSPSTGKRAYIADYVITLHAHMYGTHTLHKSQAVVFSGI